MAEIWRTRDRRMCEVTLTSARRAHILDEHAELASQLDEIRTAIKHPDLVTRDARYARRENHYRRAPFGLGWIKVVVNYRPVSPQGAWMGEVITAYPIDRPEPKEAPLWP